MGRTSRLIYVTNDALWEGILARMFDNDVTPLWNNEITPNGLAQKGSTDFYKLETKPM